MTRPGRPRWGLFSTVDVLLDVALLVVLVAFVNSSLGRGDVVAAGYGVAGAAFVAGSSLLVRGALLPILREQRALRRERRSWVR